jgi:tRNA-Thr(GGU) m(6)t(6)A37 methyltransferase TsaA
MATSGRSHGSTTAALAFTLAVVSVSAAFSLYRWRRREEDLENRIKEFEKSLGSTLEKSASERKGRVKAQQALREALAQTESHDLHSTIYPMRPIGTIQSCFSTRNGTPRQPLLVSLARACLIFDPALVPPASLEGLEEYSHCWILYVFHLNTDIEKLWRKPSQSKLKAKVRVPRLNGERKGVFATRSPHRPCPIGLTVAKVEEIQKDKVLLSGVDLVDGTVILLSLTHVSFLSNE